MTVTGTQGDRQVLDWATVTVYREGLYVSGGLQGEPRVLTIHAENHAEKDSNGEMKTSELDLCFLRWDADAERIVADPSYLCENLAIGDARGETEEASNLLAANSLVVSYDRVRQSNLSSCVYKVHMTKEVPGRAEERFPCTVTVSIPYGDRSYEVDIPVVIKPAQMEKSASWREEYENCKRIINEYLPPEGRERKLAQLEKNKHYMGAQDLRTFRWECWDIAHDALVRRAQDYLDVAAWYDNAIYAAEWTVWLTDRAFNVISGTVFGPIGAYGVQLLKNSIADIIVKCEENWDKD